VYKENKIVISEKIYGMEKAKGNRAGEKKPRVQIRGQSCNTTRPGKQVRNFGEADQVGDL
jgi:hypothetical protein